MLDWRQRSAQIGGRAMWAVPAAFVATMAMGFGLAVCGIALPFVEPAILAMTERGAGVVAMVGSMAGVRGLPFSPA